MTTQANMKTRFCPSPTGPMHLGNLRTALFNVLLAKSPLAENQAGCFLLRIEDTDNARSEMEFTLKIFHDLRWLGLIWQEGPEHPGKHGPYFQSQRPEIYAQYYQILRQNGLAYYCFCTDTELAIARKNQLNAGRPPRYSGTCRHLSDEQIAAKKAKGYKPALRFKIPDRQTVSFVDFIQGPRTFETEDIGDFIIEKADGSASFMFCNAVDDALMGVTHVMRGEDHLTNTPRQLLILKALKLPQPEYGHMPLILGFDGKPLSKRNGSQSVEALREQGYFPLAIINYLARLGHHFENEHLLSLEDLGKHFSLAHVGRAPARYDGAQLKHWQKETVLKLNESQVWEWIKNSVSNWVSEDKALLFTKTIMQNVVLPTDAQFWAMQLLTNDVDWAEAALQSIHDAGVDFLNALENAIATHGEDYQAVQTSVMQTTNKKGKQLFMPLRSTITGMTNGPELAKIFSLMGKELLLARVKLAKRQLELKFM